MADIHGGISAKTEEDFINWLSGARIYVGYCRYGWPGNGFICASAYEEREELGLMVGDLAAGDNEASAAADGIDGLASVWYSCHADPAQAMSGLISQMRDYFYNILNRGAVP